MAVTYELVKSVTAGLYERSLRGIPADTQAALRAAERRESNETARRTLRIMLDAAEAAERSSHFVCSDSGIPVFFVRIGSLVQFSGNVRQAIADGFDELIASIQPPLLPHGEITPRAIEKPRPLPPYTRVVELSACENCLNNNDCLPYSWAPAGGCQQRCRRAANRASPECRSRLFTRLRRS